MDRHCHLDVHRLTEDEILKLTNSLKKGSASLSLAKRTPEGEKKGSTGISPETNGKSQQLPASPSNFLGIYKIPKLSQRTLPIETSTKSNIKPSFQHVRTRFSSQIVHSSTQSTKSQIHRAEWKKKIHASEEKELSVILRYTHNHDSTLPQDCAKCKLERIISSESNTGKIDEIKKLLEEVRLRNTLSEKLTIGDKTSKIKKSYKQIKLRNITKKFNGTLRKGQNTEFVTDSVPPIKRCNELQSTRIDKRMKRKCKGDSKAKRSINGFKKNENFMFENDSTEKVTDMENGNENYCTSNKILESKLKQKSLTKMNCKVAEETKKRKYSASGEESETECEELKKKKFLKKDIFDSASIQQPIISRVNEKNTHLTKVKKDIMPPRESESEYVRKNEISEKENLKKDVKENGLSNVMSAKKPVIADETEKLMNTVKIQNFKVLSKQESDGHVRLNFSKISNQKIEKQGQKNAVFDTQSAKKSVMSIENKRNRNISDMSKHKTVASDKSAIKSMDINLKKDVKENGLSNVISAKKPVIADETGKLMNTVKMQNFKVLSKQESDGHVRLNFSKISNKKIEKQGQKNEVFDTQSAKKSVMSIENKRNTNISDMSKHKTVASDKSAIKSMDISQTEGSNESLKKRKQESEVSHAVSNKKTLITGGSGKHISKEIKYASNIDNNNSCLESAKSFESNKVKGTDKGKDKGKYKDKSKDKGKDRGKDHKIQIPKRSERITMKQRESFEKFLKESKAKQDMLKNVMWKEEIVNEVNFIREAQNFQSEIPSENSGSTLKTFQEANESKSSDGELGKEIIVLDQNENNLKTIKKGKTIHNSITDCDKSVNKLLKHTEPRENTGLEENQEKVKQKISAECESAMEEISHNVRQNGFETTDKSESICNSTVTIFDQHAKLLETLDQSEIQKNLKPGSHTADFESVDKKSPLSENEDSRDEFEVMLKIILKFLQNHRQREQSEQLKNNSTGIDPEKKEKKSETVSAAYESAYEQTLNIQHKNHLESSNNKVSDTESSAQESNCKKSKPNQDYELNHELKKLYSELVSKQDEVNLTEILQNFHKNMKLQFRSLDQMINFHYHFIFMNFNEELFGNSKFTDFELSGKQSEKNGTENSLKHVRNIKDETESFQNEKNRECIGTGETNDCVVVYESKEVNSETPRETSTKIPIKASVENIKIKERETDVVLSNSSTESVESAPDKDCLVSNIKPLSSEPKLTKNNHEESNVGHLKNKSYKLLQSKNHKLLMEKENETKTSQFEPSCKDFKVNSEKDTEALKNKLSHSREMPNISKINHSTDDAGPSCAEENELTKKMLSVADPDKSSETAKNKLSDSKKMPNISEINQCKDDADLSHVKENELIKIMSSVSDPDSEPFKNKLSHSKEMTNVCKIRQCKDDADPFCAKEDKLTKKRLSVTEKTLNEDKIFDEIVKETKLESEEPNLEIEQNQAIQFSVNVKKKKCKSSSTLRKNFAKTFSGCSPKTGYFHCKSFYNFLSTKICKRRALNNVRKVSLPTEIPVCKSKKIVNEKHLEKNMSSLLEENTDVFNLTQNITPKNKTLLEEATDVFNLTQNRTLKNKTKMASATKKSVQQAEDFKCEKVAAASRQNIDSPDSPMDLTAVGLEKNSSESLIKSDSPVAKMGLSQQNALHSCPELERKVDCLQQEEFKNSDAIDCKENRGKHVNAIAESLMSKALSTSKNDARELEKSNFSLPLSDELQVENENLKKKEANELLIPNTDDKDDVYPEEKCKPKTSYLSVQSEGCNFSHFVNHTYGSSNQTSEEEEKNRLTKRCGKYTDSYILGKKTDDQSKTLEYGKYTSSKYLYNYMDEVPQGSKMPSKKEIEGKHCLFGNNFYGGSYKVTEESKTVPLLKIEEKHYSLDNKSEAVVHEVAEEREMPKLTGIENQCYPFTDEDEASDNDLHIDLNKETEENEISSLIEDVDQHNVHDNDSLNDINEKAEKSKTSGLIEAENNIFNEYELQNGITGEAEGFKVTEVEDHDNAYETEDVSVNSLQNKVIEMSKESPASFKQTACKLYSLHPIRVAENTTYDNLSIQSLKIPNENKSCEDIESGSSKLIQNCNISETEADEGNSDILTTIYVPLDLPRTVLEANNQDCKDETETEIPKNLDYPTILTSNTPGLDDHSDYENRESADNHDTNTDKITLYSVDLTSNRSYYSKSCDDDNFLHLFEKFSHASHSSDFYNADDLSVNTAHVETMAKAEQCVLLSPNSAAEEEFDHNESCLETANESNEFQTEEKLYSTITSDSVGKAFFNKSKKGFDVSADEKEVNAELDHEQRIPAVASVHSKNSDDETEASDVHVHKSDIPHSNAFHSTEGLSINISHGKAFETEKQVTTLPLNSATEDGVLNSDTLDDSACAASCDHASLKICSDKSDAQKQDDAKLTEIDLEASKDNEIPNHENLRDFTLSNEEDMLNQENMPEDERCENVIEKIDLTVDSTSDDSHFHEENDIFPTASCVFNVMNQNILNEDDKQNSEDKHKKESISNVNSMYEASMKSCCSDFKQCNLYISSQMMLDTMANYSALDIKSGEIEFNKTMRTGQLKRDYNTIMMHNVEQLKKKFGSFEKTSENVSEYLKKNRMPIRINDKEKSSLVHSTSSDSSNNFKIVSETDTVTSTLASTSLVTTIVTASSPVTPMVSKANVSSIPFRPANSFVFAPVLACSKLASNSSIDTSSVRSSQEQSKSLLKSDLLRNRSSTENKKAACDTMNTEKACDKLHYSANSQNHSSTFPAHHTSAQNQSNILSSGSIISSTSTSTSLTSVSSHYSNSPMIKSSSVTKNIFCNKKHDQQLENTVNLHDFSPKHALVQEEQSVNEQTKNDVTMKLNSINPSSATSDSSAVVDLSSKSTTFSSHSTNSPTARTSSNDIHRVDSSSPDLPPPKITLPSPNIILPPQPELTTRGTTSEHKTVRTISPRNLSPRTDVPLESSETEILPSSSTIRATDSSSRIPENLSCMQNLSLNETPTAHSINSSSATSTVVNLSSKSTTFSSHSTNSHTTRTSSNDIHRVDSSSPELLLPKITLPSPNIILPPQPELITRGTTAEHKTIRNISPRNISPRTDVPLESSETDILPSSSTIRATDSSSRIPENLSCMQNLSLNETPTADSINPSSATSDSSAVADLSSKSTTFSSHSTNSHTTRTSSNDIHRVDSSYPELPRPKITLRSPILPPQPELITRGTTAEPKTVKNLSPRNSSPRIDVRNESPEIQLLFSSSSKRATDSSSRIPENLSCMQNLSLNETPTAHISNTNSNANLLENRKLYRMLTENKLNKVNPQNSQHNVPYPHGTRSSFFTDPAVGNEDSAAFFRSPVNETPLPVLQGVSNVMFTPYRDFCFPNAMSQFPASQSHRSVQASRNPFPDPHHQIQHPVVNRTDNHTHRQNIHVQNEQASSRQSFEPNYYDTQQSRTVFPGNPTAGNSNFVRNRDQFPSESAFAFVNPRPTAYVNSDIRTMPSNAPGSNLPYVDEYGRGVLTVRHELYAAPFITGNSTYHPPPQIPSQKEPPCVNCNQPASVKCLKCANAYFCIRCATDRRRRGSRHFGECTG